MKIAGIVAEYNPFHSGHEWHIAETGKMGATHIVAVMSGCYLQRGEPALWDKWTRTRGALLGGADLIIELPLPYACATAQCFARGAVSILDALGVVDMLSFGSECGEIEQLRTVAAAIADKQVKAKTSELLAEGITYAAARQRAVAALCGSEAAELLAQPNNILAIEYMAELVRRKSTIAPVTLRRMGAGHDSTELGEYASASALRGLVAQGKPEEAMRHLPPPCREVYQKAWEAGECFAPAQAERSQLAALRRMTVEDLARLPDISEGLENRIYAALRTATSMEALLEAVKTKRYSRARLRRILLCAWLGVTSEMSAGEPPYIHILGMNRRGQEILAQVGQGVSLPLSHSLMRLSQTGERAKAFAQLESTADDLYATGTNLVQPCGKDYTNGIIKL